MYQIRLIRGLALGSTALMLGIPALAQAQQSAPAEAIAALEKAREARDEARQALEEADKAFKAAEALFGGPAVTTVNNVAAPASQRTEPTADIKTAVGVVSAGSSPILCESFTEAGIAERMLTAAGEGESAAKDGLNWFTQ